MKKMFFFGLGSLVALASAFAFASSFFQEEFLSPPKAEAKWGVKALDRESFRLAGHAGRAAMAVDIVKRNLYVGKPMTLVRQELGPPDSYFFSDTIFAYKIMPFPGTDKENWHLVFMPDQKLEKVKEVKIHKKCCYKRPF